LFWLIYTMNWKSETLPMLLFGHFWRCTSYHLDHFEKEKSTRCAKHLRNKVLSSSCWSVRLGTFQAQDSRCLLFYSSFPSSECLKEDTWMPCEM
jgi:hypothetical protein